MFSLSTSALKSAMVKKNDLYPVPPLVHNRRPLLLPLGLWEPPHVVRGAGHGERQHY